jgi:hypothetical protein
MTDEDGRLSRRERVQHAADIIDQLWQRVGRGALRLRRAIVAPEVQCDSAVVR